MYFCDSKAELAAAITPVYSCHMILKKSSEICHSINLTYPF